jgi:hypothetical protein
MWIIFASRRHILFHHVFVASSSQRYVVLFSYKARASEIEAYSHACNLMLPLLTRNHVASHRESANGAETCGYRTLSTPKCRYAETT